MAISLQMVLLQMSCFCCKCPILLQIVELQMAQKVTAFGLDANGFAANCLNLGRQHKPGRWICCKWPYTDSEPLLKIWNFQAFISRTFADPYYNQT